MTSLTILCLFLFPADLQSGPQPGKKFNPYTFLMATGPNRGTSHCYVCETGDEPAVIVFARSTSEGLGDLLKQADRLLTKHQAEKLHGWVTFVGMKQPLKEPEIVNWSRKLGLRSLPLGIYELTEGPPGYRLNPEADVTVLLVKGGKVAHNFAYHTSELKAAESKKILELVPTLLK